MKNRMTIIVLVLFSLIIVFGALKFKMPGGISEITAESKGLEGQKAPDFTLLDLNDKKVSLSDFEGKVIILDFWATWCPPCQAEIPHFIGLYNEYKDKGVEIIGVALDRGGKSTVSKFSQKNNINYPVLISDGKAPDLYGGIMSIPTTFVLDKDHNIVKKYIGYKDKAVFENDIKGLL
ncbi:MAG: TlpA disulfide reductase family protein [Candidatus Omnitrophota bacterium]